MPESMRSGQNGSLSILFLNIQMDTLRSMAAFVRSAELGSLSSAARALGTTQPTVSKMVAGLERSLGVRLFERSTARVLLTEEGKRFLGRAQHVLEAYAEAAE